jgi:transposase
MSMLAELVEVVIGVDTHKRTPPPRSSTAATGAVVVQTTVPATLAGYRQLLDLADQHHGQRVRAIEGTGGYGAGLTRLLHAQGEQVVELDRPKRAHPTARCQVRPDRRHQGGPGGPQPRPPHPATLGQAEGGAPGTADRPPLCGPGRHRRPTAAARPGGRRPRGLRGRLGGLTTHQLVIARGRLRQRAAWDAETTATAASLRSLARRVQVLEREAAEHTRAITTLVRAWRPDLLRRCGVGPIVAATVLCAAPRAGPTGRSDAAWSATSPASSTDSSKPNPRFDPT